MFTCSNFGTLTKKMYGLLDFQETREASILSITFRQTR